MSTNALSQLREIISSDSANDGSQPVIQDVDVKASSPSSVTVSTGTTISPVEVTVEMEERIVTIFENQPRTYQEGMSMRIIANEYGLLLEQEMIKQNISSISVDALGVFHTLGVVPKKFSLVRDANTGQEFYLLKNMDKSASIKQLLFDVAKKNRMKVLSFNYVRNVVLNIPINLNSKSSSTNVETKPLTAQSLMFTIKEIEAMRYDFIRKFSYYNDGERDLMLVYFNIENLELNESLVTSGQ